MTTPRRERFVMEYLHDLNATKAATKAGYKHPQVQGSQLLAIPAIAHRIESEIKERNSRLKLSADWVVERLRKEALNESNGGAVRVKALELLGRHVGLFRGEVDHSTDGNTFIFHEV